MNQSKKLLTTADTLLMVLVLTALLLLSSSLATVSAAPPDDAPIPEAILGPRPIDGRELKEQLEQEAHKTAGSGLARNVSRPTAASPIQVVKTFTIDDTTSHEQTALAAAPVAAAAFEEQERLGFPYDRAPLKLVQKINIDQQASAASIAGTIWLLEGHHTYWLLELAVTPMPDASVREGDLTPQRIVKAIAFEETDAAGSNDWTSLSLDELERTGFPSKAAPLNGWILMSLEEQERLGFPYDADPLKVVKEIAIDQQATEGSVTGRIRVLEGSRLYLLLELTVMPSQLPEDDKPQPFESAFVDEFESLYGVSPGIYPIE